LQPTLAAVVIRKVRVEHAEIDKCIESLEALILEQTGRLRDWEIFRAVFAQRWLKWAGGIWFLLGTYDLVLSQFIPKDWAEESPKAYEVISTTYGWLPWWASAYGGILDPVLVSHPALIKY
jgi:hypothetical protein